MNSPCFCCSMLQQSSETFPCYSFILNIFNILKVIIVIFFKCCSFWRFVCDFDWNLRFQERSNSVIDGMEEGKTCIIKWHEKSHNLYKSFTNCDYKQISTDQVTIISNCFVGMSVVLIFFWWLSECLVRWSIKSKE